MPKYRRKPLTVEAFQFGHHEPPDWFLKKRQDVAIRGANTCIETGESERWVDVHQDDWIIHDGGAGKMSVVKPGVFAEFYEPI